MKKTEIKVGAIYTNENGVIIRVTDHYDGRVFYQQLTVNTGAIYSNGIYNEGSFKNNFTLGGEDMHHLGIGTVLQKGNEDLYRKVLSISSDGRAVHTTCSEDTYAEAEKNIRYLASWSIDELISSGHHIATQDTTEQLTTEEAEKALLALGRKVKIVKQ